VGKVPDPKSQVEQITIALIYKFMDDMDIESEELGGHRTFFQNEFRKYAWSNIFDPKLGGYEILDLYSEAIVKMNVNPSIPQLFRNIFKNAYLPYRDPETLKSFLKVINEFEYDHSEKLGDAFEYLLSVLGSQGEAGQFRTPRHIIDFMVEIIDPQKHESILDPACGTAGFLISSYKHILKHNSSTYKPQEDKKIFEEKDVSLSELTINGKKYNGDLLTPEQRNLLSQNIKGYDISPDMVRLSLVNMYLHGLQNPLISEYDTLTSEDKWNEFSDVILANPPFMSPKGGIRPHKRFSVQSNRSEVLFVNYMMEHLTPTGRCAVIVPEGIIFQSGTAYKSLRKMLVENYLVGVISLPAGVFQPYSGVKTSILWMDKTLAKKTDKILFVKIENDGFDLGAQRRPIKLNDLPQADVAIKSYKALLQSDKNFHCENISNISIVEKSRIGENGEYNLSGERYKASKILSNKYESVRLVDICKVINGRAYRQDELLDNGKYPVLRVGNFFSNKGWYYSDLELEPNKYCSKGDLLYAWSASFGPKIWDGEKCIFHYHIWKMIPDESRINKYFLFHVLNKETNSIKAEGGRGIAMIHITKEGIEQRKIPLPPLSVQEEIVAEIESYQKIIDGARQVVENYSPGLRLIQIGRF
jgi:type I restriction enzyme M protein